VKRKMDLAIQPAYRRPIRTSLLEVLKEITALTQDDALVLAVLKCIFTSDRVRLTHTLTPVKIVATVAPCRRRAG
jgi:hypothetical protein